MDPFYLEVVPHLGERVTVGRRRDSLYKGIVPDGGQRARPGLRGRGMGDSSAGEEASALEHASACEWAAWRDIDVHVHQHVHRYLATSLHNKQRRRSQCTPRYPDPFLVQVCSSRRLGNRASGGRIEGRRSQPYVEGEVTPLAPSGPGHEAAPRGRPLFLPSSVMRQAGTLRFPRRWRATCSARKTFMSD